jgi:alkylhydroperoxidase family enzyme
MLQRITEAQLRRQEVRLGAGALDYLRHLLRVAPGTFWAFVRGQPLLQHRRLVPAAPYHIARIAATQVEDCGTCVQIAVNLARHAGVAPALLRAAVAGEADQLPADLAAVYYFAKAVARADADGVEHWRPAVQRSLGEGGLGELALAIAAAGIFPTVKRALGFATSCALVQVRVDGESTPGAAPA